MKRQASKALKHMHEKLLAAQKQHEELQSEVLPKIKAAHVCATCKRCSMPRRMGTLHAQTQLAVEVHCRAIQRQQSSAAICSSTAFQPT